MRNIARAIEDLPGGNRDGWSRRRLQLLVSEPLAEVRPKTRAAIPFGKGPGLIR